MKKIFGMILMAGVMMTGCVAGDKPADEDGIVITQYSDDTGSQAMFYTMESEGKLYVIDGGWAGNANKVRNVIDEKGDMVEAWILTHPHPDHIGAFNEIYANPGNIEIRAVYAVDMDYDMYKSHAQEWDGFEIYDAFCVAMEKEEKLKYLYAGDELNFEGMELEVFNAYEDDLIDYSSDLANQGSLVFQVSGEEESMLFCGDVYGEVMCNKIMAEYGEELESDYLQMGHHGNNSVTPDFVKLVNPRVVFFDAPQWLIEGENYDAKDNIAFVTELGMKVYTYITAPNEIVVR